MQLSVNDYVGFTGVFILLIAYLLNLAGKLSRHGLPYILMNIFGAGLACLASWLIHYIPFVVLEGTWTVVSIGALVNYITEKSKAAR